MHGELAANPAPAQMIIDEVTNFTQKEMEAWHDDTSDIVMGIHDDHVRQTEVLLEKSERFLSNGVYQHV